MAASQGGFLQNLVLVDKRCTEAVQRWSCGPLGDYIALPGAVLFGWNGIWVALGGVYLLARDSGLYLALLSLAVGQVTNRVLKVGLQRQRPPQPTDLRRAVPVKVPGPEDPDGASFPSGDTMAGSAIGGALALSGCSSFWWALGLYTGFCRVYYWCHYISDVLSGYVVGSLAALLVAVLSRSGEHLQWWHILVAMVPFVLVMKLLKKLQLKAAARLGRSGL